MENNWLYLKIGYSLSYKKFPTLNALVYDGDIFLSFDWDEYLPKGWELTETQLEWDKSSQLVFAVDHTPFLRERKIVHNAILHFEHMEEHGHATR